MHAYYFLFIFCFPGWISFNLHFVYCILYITVCIQLYKHMFYNSLCIHMLYKTSLSCKHMFVNACFHKTSISTHIRVYVYYTNLANPSL